MKRLQLFLLMLLALPIGMLAAGTTWQTATLLEQGSSATGSLSSDVTVHWYKIIVPENGEATIKVAGSGDLSLDYTNLYAKDAENGLHSRGYCWRNSDFTVKHCSAGTYYVEIKRGSGSGSYTVSYSFKATSSSYSNDREPNDTYQNAVQLTNGAQKTGHLGYYYWDDMDAVDWYKIVVPENGAVQVTVIAHGELALDYSTLYALDENNGLHSRGYCWRGNEESNGVFTVKECAPGTYYLEMKRGNGQGGYTVKYDFTATSSAYPDDNEPNQTYDKATLLKNGVEETGHFGYYYWDDMDQVDWYKIEVPENGTVQVTVIAHGELALDYSTLYSLDNENGLHNRGYCWRGDEESNGVFAVKECAPGIYYLEMKRGYGQGGYTVKYDFTATSSSYPDDNEPNQTYDKATLLKNGIEETGHFGYYYWNDMDDVDWYKIEVPSNGAVQVTVIAHGDLGLDYTTLYALDENNELHSRGYCWRGSEEDNGVFTVKECARGIYYLQMKRGYGQGGYTVKYNFTAMSSEYSNDSEPNDTWENAKLLKRGNTKTGHLGYYYWNNMDAVDWYKIDVPRDGKVTITVAAHGELGLDYTTIYALDANNAVHSRGYCWRGSDDDNGVITIPDCAPGTYYVEMKRGYGQGGYSIGYKFEQNTYATDAEPNNDKASALTLGEGATVAGHLGYYYWDDRDNADWYKLSLSGKSTITVTYQAEEGFRFDYVTLYDSENRSKAYGWSNGTDNINTFTAKDLGPGTYYLEMKRNSGQGYYLVTYGSTIGSVEAQEQLPDEPADDPNNPDNPDDPNNPDNPDNPNNPDNPDTPNNPDNPIIEGPDKDFINDVGKDLLNQWDADSYRNILELLQQAMSFNTEEISEWGANALGSVKTAITTPYNGISNGYMLMLRASLFTGHFKAVNDRWIYEGPADDLQFTYPDKAGTTCVARILTSGDTKTVSMPYEFDEDEDDDDDDNGILGKAKDLTNGVKVIAAEVPEHFEISFTHGNTQLMLTTIDFDLSCFTDNWSPTTNGLIVSINSTFAKSNSGVRRRGGPGTFELSMNRVGYQPVTGISFSFAAKNDGKQIMSLDVKAPGTINVDNGLIDIDAEKGVTINDIGIESLKVDLDVMGRLQARGQIDDLPNFVNKAIKASNCEDEAEAKQIKGELDNMMQGNFYYDGNPEPKGSLGMGVTYDKDKGEWKLEPTISFKSDNSTYPIKTYFSEENFPEFVGGVKTIISELVGVATTMREKVEKMNEEATNATTNPDDNKACLIVWRNETQKDYYVLEEKPKITMSNGDFILTTTNTTVTYKFEDVLKFTLSESTATAIEEVKAVAEPSVERTSEKVIFTGCTPKSAIRIYSIGGQLLDTQWADANGRAEVSISGLTAGVYVVKSDSVTIKIAKR